MRYVLGMEDDDSIYRVEGEDPFDCDQLPDSVIPWCGYGNPTDIIGNDPYESYVVCAGRCAPAVTAIVRASSKEEALQTFKDQYKTRFALKNIILGHTRKVVDRMKLFAN